MRAAEPPTTAAVETSPTTEADRAPTPPPDTTPPPLLLDPSLTDGLEVGTNHIVVSGVTDPNAKVVIAGIELMADGDGAFAADVPLVFGPNRIEVVATDETGNATGAAFDVVYVVDAPPPPPKQAPNACRHDHDLDRAAASDHARDHDDGDEGHPTTGDRRRPRVDDRRRTGVDHDDVDVEGGVVFPTVPTTAKSTTTTPATTTQGNRRTTTEATTTEATTTTEAPTTTQPTTTQPPDTTVGGPHDRGDHDYRSRGGVLPDVLADRRHAASAIKADLRKPSSSRRRIASERKVGSMPTARSTSTSVATPITAEYAESSTSRAS